MASANSFSLVLITDSYPPYLDATSLLNQDLAQEISSIFEVTVLAPIPWRDFSWKSSFSRSPSGYFLRRFPVPFSATRSLLLKPIKFLFFAFFCTVYVLLKNHPRSLYLIHSSPPIQIPLFAILVPLRNIFSRRLRRLALIVHDLYPDIARSSGKNSLLLSFLVALSNRMFRVSYNSYDLIFACSPAIQDRLNGYYDVPARNILTVYNWSLFEPHLKQCQAPLTYSFHPATLDSLPQLLTEGCQKPLNPIFLIGNFGSLHLPWQSGDFLAALAAELSEPVSCFVRGAAKHSLLSAFEGSNQYLDLRPWVSPDLLYLEYLRCSPITFVSLSSSACECAFPSRISTALCWGSPVLFYTDDVRNSLASFIIDSGIGMVVSPSSDISSVVESLRSIRSSYNVYSGRCRSVYHHNMSRSRSLAKYKSSLLSLW
jgi:hypothetical protein